jgi:hypothetical protein
MKLSWNDPRSNKFETTIGLITSNGSSGPNIMAREWTHHLSYKSGLIAVSLGYKDISWKYTSESRIWYEYLCIVTINTF